jgi:hypothetical protein
LLHAVAARRFTLFGVAWLLKITCMDLLM